MKKIKFATVVFLLILGLAGISSAQEDKALPYYRAGNKYFAQKNYDLALRYYHGATNRDPELWQAYQGMGNCYFYLGDKAKALENFQKALVINPDNPKLTATVKALQAQVGAGEAPATSSETGENTSRPLIELVAMGGVALDATAAQAATLSIPATTIHGAGIGGGLEVYYLADNHLGVGFIIDYCSYNKTNTSPATFSNSSLQDTVCVETISGNTNNIEIMPAMKYKFDGDSIRPYLLGSVGYSTASTHFSDNYGNFSNGQPLVTPQNQSGPGPNFSGPMFELGLGGEYALDTGLNLFLQVKYCEVFFGTTTHPNSPNLSATLTSIPIQGGLSFDF